MMSTAKQEQGANHWLVQEGYQVFPSCNHALMLCKLECESWLEIMTVSEIDKVLSEIDEISSQFDAAMENIDYLEHTGEYVIEILPEPLYQSQQKNKESFPKAEEIPLSIKIIAIQMRGQQNFKTRLTRNHLLAAAYRLLVQGYHKAQAARDTEMEFKLLSDVSALLALASNMDIAANGFICFDGVAKSFSLWEKRERAAKSAKVRGVNKRAAQAAFVEAKEKNPQLSARQFAMQNYEKYGYSGYEGLLNNITKKELEKSGF